MNEKECLVIKCAKTFSVVITNSYFTLISDLYNDLQERNMLVILMTLI